MNAVMTYIRALTREAIAGWNRFWFTPSDAATLAFIRICAGLMLLYTHLVWSRELLDFVGPDAWVNVETATTFHTLPPATEGGNPIPNVWNWSYLWHLQSPGEIWAAHLAGLAVFVMLTVGFATRVTSVLAFVVAVSYTHRLSGALFGLDQINTMLALYLMVGSSGRAYSVDAWLNRRRALGTQEWQERLGPTVSTNIAIRLIQLHMCVIYFFAGVAKLQGSTWWRGDALWGSFANLEYQTLDMTWMAHYPLIVGAMTHLVAFWELSFPAIIWPRLTRPVVLAVALPLHLGIGICMGMMTFGLIMLVGCSSFIPPEHIRAFFQRRAMLPAAALASAASSEPVRSGQGGQRRNGSKSAKRR